MEVMIAVVILAIIMSLAVPRLSGNVRRNFNFTVDRVSDLLVMFAQRDTLARNPVGLSYDPGGPTLSLVVLETDLENPDLADWMTDRFVTPVRFPDIVDPYTIEIAADHEVVDTQYWPLGTMPGETRPEITVSFWTVDGDHGVQLILPAHGVSPRRVDLGGGRARRGGAGTGDDRIAVDLDAAGRTREDW
jgi:type II secretory pathway pseudopilin PulG